MHDRARLSLATSSLCHSRPSPSPAQPAFLGSFLSSKLAEPVVLFPCNSAGFQHVKATQALNPPVQVCRLVYTLARSSDLMLYTNAAILKTTAERRVEALGRGLVGQHVNITDGGEAGWMPTIAVFYV